jgi:hypothetical protein
MTRCRRYPHQFGRKLTLCASGRYGDFSPPAQNVVLVHGLFADGSSWPEVIPHLQAAGLNVTSVQNPLTTFDDAVASVNRVLDRQQGRTVLADHRFAEMLVTEVGIHRTARRWCMLRRGRPTQMRIMPHSPSASRRRLRLPGSSLTAMRATQA